MSSRSGRNTSPGWGAPVESRWRVRGGTTADMAGGTLLLSVWVLLWAFFVLAVVEPAAGLHHAPRRPAPADELSAADAAPGERGDAAGPMRLAADRARMGTGRGGSAGGETRRTRHPGGRRGTQPVAGDRGGLACPPAVRPFRS